MNPDLLIDGIPILNPHPVDGQLSSDPGGTGTCEAAAQAELLVSESGASLFEKSTWMWRISIILDLGYEWGCFPKKAVTILVSFVDFPPGSFFFC